MSLKWRKRNGNHFATPVSKAANAGWFTPTALSPLHDDEITIHFAMASALTNTQLQYTVDNGTSCVTFGTGVAPAANASYEFKLNISKTALFNLRQTTAGTVTVTFCQMFH
jgi:hypothetical protein